MKRCHSILLVLILVAFNSIGQSTGEPTLNGTWISKPTGASKLTHRIEIVDDGVKVRMSHEITEEGGETVKYEHNFFTDGRGETNKRSDGSDFKSTSKRRGSKLTIKYEVGRPDSSLRRI